MMKLLLLYLTLRIGCNGAAYVSFMGRRLANHSFVDFRQVGVEKNDCIQCHTELTTCCSASQGSDRGDWFFPNGDRVQFSGDTFERRMDGRIELCRGSDQTLSLSGIYLCAIDTYKGRSFVRVGIYGNEGDVRLSGGMEIGPAVKDGDGKLQFTLTCISTGGPATTVTWTRDSTTLTEGNTTQLTDSVLAQYNHTLIANKPGHYTCTVANEKPSNASVSMNLPGVGLPRNITAIQESETSIRILWIPPSNATSYTIILYHATDDETTESNTFTLLDGSANTWLISDLQNGETYSISLVARGNYFPSENTKRIVVGLVPGELNVMARNITATSIEVSWTISTQSVVDIYEVEWKRSVTGYCTLEHQGSVLMITDTYYLIEGVEEDSWYGITVIAGNVAGKKRSTTIFKTLTAVPSVAPGSVFASPDASTSLSLHWDPVECIHTNGELTGYSVRYWEVGSVINTTKFIVGGTVRDAIILGLRKRTSYSIEVAAVNLVGSGNYSPPITSATQPFASAPTGLRAVQENATTLRVSWIPPTPLGDTTGYRISYEMTNSTSYSIDVNGHDHHLLLTGLMSGETYTITIIGLSERFPSQSSMIKITLVSAPDSPKVVVKALMSTSITLSWSVSRDSVVTTNTSYEVMWVENDEEEVMVKSSGSLNGTSFTINQLEMSTMYRILVKATNIAGAAESLPIIVSTVPESHCERLTAVIAGGITGSVLLIMVLTSVLVIALVLKCKREIYPDRFQRRCYVHEEDTQSRERTYTEPAIINTSDNEAYNLGNQRKKRVSAYEMTLICREPCHPMTRSGNGQ